jgi:hypothetical protein
MVEWEQILLTVPTSLPQENRSIDQHVFFESPFSSSLFITVVDSLGHRTVKVPKF